MFEAFLKDLHQVDLVLAAKSAPTGSDLSSLSRLIDLSKDLCVKQLEADSDNAQLKTVNQQLQYTALRVQQQVGVLDILAVLEVLQQVHTTADKDVQQQSRQCSDTQQEIRKTGASKQFTGPCVAAVEPVLEQHNIEHQVCCSHVLFIC